MSAVHSIHSRGWSKPPTKPVFAGGRSDPSLSNVKSVVDSRAPTEALLYARRRKQAQAMNLRRAKAVGASLGAMSREEAIERCMAMGRRRSRERSSSRERSTSGTAEALAPQLLQLLQPELPSDRPTGANLEDELRGARERGDDGAALNALRAIVCREIAAAQRDGDGERCVERADVQEHISTIVVLTNAFAMAQLHAQAAGAANERDTRVAQLLRLADQLTKRPILPSDVSLRLRAVTLNNMGCFSRYRGRHHAALKYLHKALELELRGEGADGGDSGSTHLNLCATLSSLGRHQEAAEQAEMAIDSLFAALPHPVDGSAIAHAATSIPLECGDTASLLTVAYSNLASEYENLSNYEGAMYALQIAIDINDRFELESSPPEQLPQDAQQPQQQQARGRLVEWYESLHARMISSVDRRQARGRSYRVQQFSDEENYQPVQPDATTRQPAARRLSGPAPKTKAPTALRLPALQPRASSALGLVDASETNTAAKFFNNAVPVEQHWHGPHELNLQPRPQSYSHLPPILARHGPGQSQQHADLYEAGNDTAAATQAEEDSHQLSPYETPDFEAGSGSLSVADIVDFPASFGFAPAASETGGLGLTGFTADCQSLLIPRPMSRASASSAGGL